MFSYQLAWKNFNLSLPNLHTWFVANAGEHYRGLSADSVLRVWFSEDPGSTVWEACELYWADLAEESDEAIAYISQSTIEVAIATLRTDLHLKDWGDMSAAERKLVIGQTPTNAELGL